MWVWRDRQGVCYDYISDFIHAQSAVRRAVPERDTALGGSDSPLAHHNTKLLLQESSYAILLSHKHIALQGIMRISEQHQRIEGRLRRLEA